MKPVLACLVTVVLSAAALAQSSSSAARPASVIEGIVTKEPGSEPVKKAVIELIAESPTAGGNYTAVTGADGMFRIEAVVPGQYRMYAERSGLLEADKHHARSEGRVLTLAAGQELKNLQIRMQAAAVVRGRITDEDGEPLPNATVTVLRQTFASGHSHWEQQGAEHTNDLGEYRIASLPAGNYYVSVNPPPDFKSLIEEAGRARPESAGVSAPDKPAGTTYQTMYYPGTADRSQATAIQLRAGDEFPVNLSLTPSPSLSIRGSVVNLPPQSTASIMLQSRDFGLVLNGAEIHRDGSFVIRDVAPGAYTILATVENSVVPMTARQTLQVANSVEGLRLAPQPGALVRGRLRLEAKGNVGQIDPGQIYLALESTDRDDASGVSLGQGFPNLAQLEPDGSFEWKDVPPGDYYVRLLGETDVSRDWFVKSQSVGGRAVDEAGFSVNGGYVALDLAVSANGAVVDGVVTDHKGESVANALIVAVPEARLRGRLDRFRKTATDQNGRFTLHGIPPGDYTLLAWESTGDEAYYDPEFLKSCEGQGSALHLSEGDRKSVQVQVIPETEEQE